MNYIYGISADPITKAHCAILKHIAKHLQTNDELYLLISNNDSKCYKSSYEDREYVVKQTLGSLAEHPQFHIMKQEYRTRMFINTYFKGKETDITIVVGEDEWKAILAGKWVHSDDLIKNFNFLVIRRYRNVIAMPEGQHKDIKCITVKMPSPQVEISSSKTREIFSINPDTRYHEVSDYIHRVTFKAIKDREMYFQNGKAYEDACEAKKEEYNRLKEKNHWGEPSVTTDVIAYNGDEILCIRRKNWPYRNYWALCGGFMEKTDDDLASCAAREFEEETTLRYAPSSFEQIKAYGHNFDPRMKICDVAFAVRIHREDMKKAKGADDAMEARWFKINDLPALAFHHEQIIADWQAKIKNEN